MALASKAELYTWKSASSTGAEAEAAPPTVTFPAVAGSHCFAVLLPIREALTYMLKFPNESTVIEYIVHARRGRAGTGWKLKLPPPPEKFHAWGENEKLTAAEEKNGAEVALLFARAHQASVNGGASANGETRSPDEVALNTNELVAFEYTPAGTAAGAGVPATPRSRAVRLVVTPPGAADQRCATLGHARNPTPSVIGGGGGGGTGGTGGGGGTGGKGEGGERHLVDA